MEENKPLKENSYLVLDTETARYKSFTKGNRIIEIGWVIIKKAKIVKRQSYVIYYEHPEDLYILPKVQVTQQLISKGTQIESVIKELLVDIQYCDILVGHNIRYDIQVLQNEINKIDLLNGKIFTENLALVDTLVISRKLFPKAISHKLKDVIRILEIPEKFTRHKAINDVYYTTLCMGKMLRQLRLEKGISTYSELKCFLNS